MFLKSILSATTTACLLLGAVPVTAQDLYAAIAIGRHNGAVGYQTNARSRAAAERGAYNACIQYGGRGCQVVVWVRNACGALASGDRVGYGYGYHTLSRQAQNRALAECRARTSNCQLRAVVCPGS